MAKIGLPRRVTEAEKRRLRVNGYRSGKRAKVVTPEEVIAAKLAKLDPEVAKLIEDFVNAQAGDMSVLDKRTATSLAAAEMVRRRVFEQLSEEGLTVEEMVLNSEGKVVGKRLKVHPLLENLKWLHETLGQTAKQAGLTREAKPRGAQAEEIRDALARDARLRAADKSRLPPPDPELFRMTPEELERSIAESQDRLQTDPVYRARHEAAWALQQESARAWEKKQREGSALEKEPS